jgi:hypothetical protein
MNQRVLIIIDAPHCSGVFTNPTPIMYQVVLVTLPVEIISKGTVG